MTPNIQIGLVSNVFIRQMIFENIGDTENGHSHPFDHVTLLTNGSLAVTIDGSTTEFTAPQMIFIEKTVEHTLVALENNTTAYCIHALRDINKSDDIVAPEMVPTKHTLSTFIKQNTGRE